MFCSFTLLVCREKNILPNLTKSQEPEPVGAGYFWLLVAGAEATWKKNRSLSRSRLGKKSGAGAVKKFAGTPALKKLK